jgi:sigma-B regulation protein RsbU (phosphoserine phosphatase)
VLSRISPARRIALVVVAAFDVAEAVVLWVRGFENHSWVALALGFALLLLLLGFELAEHAAAKRDHELSREISEWLLPHTPPYFAGVEIAFSNRMANHVGSDYFNVFPRWAIDAPASNHRLFVVMADVAGTGLQGALLMATFVASLRVLADSRMPLRELASEMNRWCWDRSLGGRHFTMAFLADLDPENGALEYVSAGHQPPVIFRGKGGFERLEVGGFPLGALSDSTYELGAARLESGDSLVVFTDGVVKAENRGGELFGENRVLNSLRAADGLPAHAILNQLTTSMLSFCGAIQQPDDLSFVVVRRSPGRA